MRAQICSRYLAVIEIRQHVVDGSVLIQGDDRPNSPSRRNRIHLVVDDLDTDIARLRSGGLRFRSNLVTGPGGRQILLAESRDHLRESHHQRTHR